MKNKQVFITFEGGEGCGKSTMSKMLAEYFATNNYDALFTREPGGVEVCEQIRNVVLHGKGNMHETTQALLFFASRNQLVQDVILPALKNGKMVICDRFFDSSFAYQGYAGGVPLKYLEYLTEITCKTAIPTLTLFFDLNPEIAFKRKGGRDENDRFEMKNIEFHNKVREGFLQLANKNKKRFRIIDASKSIEEVFGQVLKVLRDEKIIK